MNDSQTQLFCFTINFSSARCLSCTRRYPSWGRAPPRSRTSAPRFPSSTSSTTTRRGGEGMVSREFFSFAHNFFFGRVSSPFYRHLITLDSFSNEPPMDLCWFQILYFVHTSYFKRWFEFHKLANCYLMVLSNNQPSLRAVLWKGLNLEPYLYWDPEPESN